MAMFLGYFLQFIAKQSRSNRTDQLEEEGRLILRRLHELESSTEVCSDTQTPSTDGSRSTPLVPPGD